MPDREASTRRATMNCQDAIALKHAWADGELDLVRTLELEQHLRNCPACSSAFENVRALKSVMKAEGLYFKAPAGLERSIRASLPSEKRRTARPVPGWWQWFRMVIPTAGVAVAAVLFILAF